jgi:hypothetical protein
MPLSAPVDRRIAVAIPAFRRPDLLQDLLHTLPMDRISTVYVSIDGEVEQGQGASSECLSLSRDFARRVSVPVHVHQHSFNVGAAVNVVGTANWMFSRHSRGVVIEDDCRPIPAFFDFVNDALDMYGDDENVWLVGGSQFIPRELIKGSHVLSSYPLIWGWGTSRKKWERAFGELQKSAEERTLAPEWNFRLRSSIDSYWCAGHRRSVEGRVDAWDTPLVHVMRKSGALAVLPQMPLVSNVGDDMRATHTSASEGWTRVKPVEVKFDSTAGDSAVANAWLEKNLYRIRRRHILTTKIRWLVDHCSRQHNRPSLHDRLKGQLGAWPHHPQRGFGP